MLKKHIKNLFWNLKGGYKPKEFWDKWSDTFMEDEWQVRTHTQHDWMLRKVKEIKPKTILEVGCGFGRNIRFLLDNNVRSQITGVDISPKMLAEARKYVSNKNVDFGIADVLALPFQDRLFDLVLVHGLLMHIKPEDVKKAISEILRVAKKSLISVEQNYLSSDEGAKKYTFVHNYKNLYEEQGVSVEEYVHNTKDGLDYCYVKVR